MRHLEMINSALFVLTLVLMDQVRSGLALSGMRSENRVSQDRAVVVSAEASIIKPTELSMSRDMQSESHDPEDMVVVVSAGASFSEPISELPVSSPQAQKSVQHIAPEDSAKAHQMKSALLESSAGAALSGLPVIEPPMSSSQGQKFHQRRDREHLPPLASGRADGAEDHQMTSALLEVAKHSKSSLTAAIPSQTPPFALIMVFVFFVLAVLAMMVLLVLKLMKSRQEREVNARLMGNDSQRSQTYVSRRSKKVAKAQTEDEAAVKIQKHFRIFVQSPSKEKVAEVVTFQEVAPEVSSPSTKMSRLYIAETAAIHVFDMDLKTGALTAIAERVDTDACGSFLALSPDGKFLYSIAKPGAAAFAIDEASGAITHINSVKCDIDGNSHASIVSNGGLGVLVLAAYGSGGVNVARILPDGSLKVVPGTSKQHEGGSNVYQPGSGNEQEAAHPHSCFIDPSGKWALVSDLGQDKLYTYAVDIEAGTLTEKSVLKIAPGAGPRHMCFHPKGQWMYGLNELDCTVNVYEFCPQGLVLVKIFQTISTLPDGYNNRDHKNAKNAAGKPASGPNRPEQTNATADIHITPDGRFLYASNRGHDSLVCFSVGTDGTLALKGFTYTRGEHPHNFSIHPSGRWLLAANQDSNNVVVFKLDSKTGGLTFSGVEITVKEPWCIKWAVQTENQLKELIKECLSEGDADV